MVRLRSISDLPDLDLSSTIFIQSCSLSLICFVEVDSWSCLWCDSGVRGGVRSEDSGSRNSVTLPSPDSEHQGTLRCHHQANIKHQESVIRSIKSHLLKKSYLKICKSQRLLRQCKLNATYLCYSSFLFHYHYHFVSLRNGICCDYAVLRSLFISQNHRWPLHIKFVIMRC